MMSRVVPAWLRRRSEAFLTRLQPRFDAIGSPLFRIASDDFNRRPSAEAVRASDTPSIESTLERLDARGASMWVVTTFDRPEACGRVIDGLRRSAPSLDEKPLVVVICDACDADYGDVRNSLQRGFGERGVFIEATRHLGKKEFWRIHQLIFDLVRVYRPSSVLQLQDDVELIPGGLESARAILDHLGEPAVAALSLFPGAEDDPAGRWIRFEREATPCGRAWLTQWLDLPGFLATPRFFEALEYRLRPIHALRWAFDSTKSSGVGRQITRRLRAHDVGLYQVVRPLVLHGSEPSRMNPEARSLRPMNNRADA